MFKYSISLVNQIGCFINSILELTNFDLFKQINSVDGNFQLGGLLRENQIIVDSWNSQFKKIKFNNSFISNLKFDASVNNNIIYTKFFSDSKDFNISGNIDFDIANYKVEFIEFDLIIPSKVLSSKGCLLVSIEITSLSNKL